MREIEFRVFDLQTDKMYKVMDIDFVCGVITASETDCITDLIQLPYDSSEFSIIEQYTGLKDKNGKKIFEGDIVNIWGGESLGGYFELNEKCQVKYSGASFCPVDSKECHYDFGMIENIEIIGNINQDKHLIK